MPNAIILLNGQKFELDESLVATDQHVRDALAPYAPDIQTAQIARSTKDGQVVITITKRPGTKGSGPTPLDALIAAPVWINPALALAWQLKHQETLVPLSLITWIEHYPAIEDARNAGSAAVHEVGEALQQLQQSVPIPAPLRLPDA